MVTRLTRRADSDLVECLLYGIEIFGPARAEAYLGELYRCFEMIARHPWIGRARDEFRPPIRTHHHGRHTIAYHIDADGDVLIIGVIRDGANLAQSLRAIDLRTDE